MIIEWTCSILKLDDSSERQQLPSAEEELHGVDLPKVPVDDVVDDIDIEMSIL
jgi:hypothetical protein